MEEVLRLNASASTVIKEAVVDMEILGCHIPKGTQLLIPLWGPSINQPAIPVPEKIRAQQGTVPGDWKSHNAFPSSEFHPER